MDQDDSASILNVVVESTLQALVDTGILVKMSGGQGYNGITIPEGVSWEYLSDVISDNFNGTIEEMAVEAFSLDG